MKNRLRHIWQGMKQRCLNPASQSYKDYGGRGIKVCDRWRDSYENFVADMGPRPSPKHSIDRINNDGDYEPGNCRWATPVEQMRNQQRSIYVEVNGQRLHAKDASQVIGRAHRTILNRLKKGLPPELALSSERLPKGPKRQPRPTIHRNVKTHCPLGHPYSGENLYHDEKGFGRCRTCKRMSDARYKARRAAREGKNAGPTN